MLNFVSSCKTIWIISEHGTLLRGKILSSDTTNEMTRKIFVYKKYNKRRIDKITQVGSLYFVTFKTE